MFARKSLQTFSRTEKDALYAALNREDWNWRRLNMEIAQLAVRSVKASGRNTCCVPCHYIPVRSWPLFRARELMHDLIQSFTQEINP